MLCFVSVSFLLQWRPGRGDGYKKTEVCKGCSLIKNVCQTCLLDLEFGLPSQLRDAVLAASGDELIPESDANREFYNQRRLMQLNEGVGSDDVTANDSLIKVARASIVDRDSINISKKNSR